MAQEEKYGARDLTYSAWHRRRSISRFIDIQKAKGMSQIDVDYIEYDDETKEPLIFIETAIDVGQTYKPGTVTRNLAKAVGGPRRAYTVLYKISETEQNPADPNVMDIEQFRVKRLWPEPDDDWNIMSPEEYAKWLLKMRKYVANRLDAKQFGG